MNMRTYKEITLDKFQEDAFALVDQNESVFVAAPTGAGKTLVADYAIDKSMQAGKGVIYTAPVKALSNQKYRDFRKLYGDENVGILTGDVSINPLAPVLVMTTEIFRNVELTEPARLNDVAWIIFDEVHYLGDQDRGTVWEESIMLKPRHLKVLGLSATVPNVHKIAHWIETLHDEPVTVITEKERPVPLHFFYQCNNHLFDTFESLCDCGHVVYDERVLRKKRYRERHSFQHSPNRADTLFKHLQENEQLPVIYFAFSRRKCETLADELLKFNFLSEVESESLIKRYRELLHLFDIKIGKDKTAQHVEKLLAKGIAYHHAGLLPTLKEVIERLFCERLIKVIFTTETFALGVNMPARSVIFDDVRKFYGSYHANLKTRDLYQMAGRAGRRGIDPEGHVFIRVNPFGLSMQELKRMVSGRSELVFSQFASNYATILNLYREMGDKIIDIYPSSFHFYQSSKADRKKARWHLKSKLQVLKELGYITPRRELSPKGELAARMYSYELQIGELYERGMLENLSAKDLALVITALVYEPRKGVRPPALFADAKKYKQGMDKVVRGITKVEKRFDVYPHAKQFSFHLSKAMSEWYDGATFEQIMNMVDFDDGEIVRYFRMAVQTLRELQAFAGFDEAFKKTVRKALDKINRDAIDAEKQLRQEM